MKTGFYCCLALPAPCFLLHIVLFNTTSSSSPSSFNTYTTRHCCLLCAGRSRVLFSSSHTYSIVKNTMAVKRQLDNEESSSRPLKKRNGVTAGIGRTSEVENNGVGYGRTDDNQEVSHSISLCNRSRVDHLPSSFCNLTFSTFTIPKSILYVSIVQLSSVIC